MTPSFTVLRVVSLLVRAVRLAVMRPRSSLLLSVVMQILVLRVVDASK